MVTLPSLQMQEPSTAEQVAWLWQEQVDVQPGPYKPGGHTVVQSSPWGAHNAQSYRGKKHGGEFEQSQTSWRGEEEMQVLFTSH